MLYAANIVKEHDLAYLEKEIKRRGVLKAPLAYTDKQIDEFWKQLSANLYATMTCVTGMTLADEFGFGKQRLQKFRKEFLNKTQKTLDLDWIGEHYVTLEDYAVHLMPSMDWVLTWKESRYVKSRMIKKMRNIRWRILTGFLMS